jgi:hypothetical protein
MDHDAISIASGLSIRRNRGSTGMVRLVWAVGEDTYPALQAVYISGERYPHGPRFHHSARSTRASAGAGLVNPQCRSVRVGRPVGPALCLLLCRWHAHALGMGVVSVQFRAGARETASGNAASVNPTGKLDGSGDTCIRESSNGRTLRFERGYVGSTPTSRTSSNLTYQCG